MRREKRKIKRVRSYGGGRKGHGRILEWQCKKVKKKRGWV